MTASHARPELEQQAPRRGGHGWMMMVCCVPMLVIGVVLVATGVVTGSFLIYAVACTAMMALMMRGMNHGGMNHGGDRAVHHHVTPPPPPSPDSSSLSRRRGKPES